MPSLSKGLFDDAPESVKVCPPPAIVPIIRVERQASLAVNVTVCQLAIIAWSASVGCPASVQVASALALPLPAELNVAIRPPHLLKLFQSI